MLVERDRAEGSERARRTVVVPRTGEHGMRGLEPNLSLRVVAARQLEVARVEAGQAELLRVARSEGSLLGFVEELQRAVRVALGDPSPPERQQRLAREPGVAELARERATLFGAALRFRPVALDRRQDRRGGQRAYPDRCALVVSSEAGGEPPPPFGQVAACEPERSECIRDPERVGRLVLEAPGERGAEVRQVRLDELEPLVLAVVLERGCRGFAKARKCAA